MAQGLSTGGHAFPEIVKNRMDAIIRASVFGQVCVMACTNAKTGEQGYMICGFEAEKGGEVDFYPLGLIPLAEDLSTEWDYIRAKGQLNG